MLIIKRPEKEIYASYPVEPYQEPYFKSFWNAGHLPMIYKVESSKWPVNTFSPIATVSQVNNNTGFAEIFVSGSYEEYEAGDWLTLELGVYSGIVQIVQKISAQQYVINSQFKGNETGTAQYYFKNYAILMKIYAGIPDGHPLAAQDPTTFIATLRATPASDNIATFDVSPLVRQKLSFEYLNDSVGMPNDLSLWTSLYVEIAETY